VFATEHTKLTINEQAAAVFTEVLGKKIEHVNLAPEDMTMQFEAGGIPHDYAEMLTNLDVAISHGAEDAMNTVVEDITGRKPQALVDFVKNNREVWL
jgi:festuclavine dehydrogenase